MLFRSCLPIVAFSANAFASDIDACHAAGMDDYVTKPVRKDALLAAIRRNLARVPAEATRAATEPPVVDSAALDALESDVGSELCRRTLATFLDSTQKKLDLLPALVSDRDRLRIEVHAIKGAARTVGALRLAAQAERIERGLINGARMEAGDLTALLAGFESYRAAPAVSSRLSEPAIAAG